MRKTLRGYLSHLKFHQEKSTRTALFLVRFFFFLHGKLRYLVQNPWLFWPPREDDSDPHPCDTFLRVPGNWPARSWADATCWNLLMSWRAMMAFRRPHALGRRRQYNSPRWLEKRGRGGTPEEFPLACDNYPPGARPKPAEREPSRRWSGRLSSVTIFCWKMVSGLQGQVNTKDYRIGFHF